MTDITFIPIKNEPSYITNINVFGRDLRITFTWNTREQDRSVLIEDTEEGVFLENTFIELESPVDLNANARLLDYNYQVFLVRKTSKSPKRKINMLYWDNYYILTFISKEEIPFTPDPNIKPSKPKPAVPPV